MLPNKHAADIYKMGHSVCSLDVAGLNTNTRMRLHQESGRFANLLPLKPWHAGLTLQVCMNKKDSVLSHAY